MRRRILFIVVILLVCTSCQQSPPPSENVGETVESEILLRSEESHQEPATIEPEEHPVTSTIEVPDMQSGATSDSAETSIKEYESINLANATQTEFLYEGKIGDEFLGLTIWSLDYTQRIYNGEWHDQLVAVFFDGEKVVEGYYARFDGPDFIKIIGDMSSIPDFIEEERSVFANKMYVGAFAPDVIELYMMADEYMAMHEEEVSKNSDKIPYFYCRLQVDNIRLAFMAESSAMRSGDLIEVLSFEFAGYMEPELFWAM